MNIYYEFCICNFVCDEFFVWEWGDVKMNSGMMIIFCGGWEGVFRVMIR